MPENVPIRSCPTCSARSVEILHHQRFVLSEGHPLPSSFDIVLCKRCGMVYADTKGTESDYYRYYADHSKYADQGTSTGGGGNSKDRLRLEITAATIAAALPDRQGRIVDIGCANGGLLGSLKALGYTRLLGVDPSSACVANTQELFGVAAVQGTLMKLPTQCLSSDLIVVSHVFEHVLEPRKALENFRSILSANGLVYVEVPDADRYIDCLASPFQDFNIEHINHFQQASLNHLFLVSGFKCITSGSKTLDAAPGVSYPALYGVFQMMADGKQYRPSTKPPGCGNIRRYIDASSVQLAKIEIRLQEVLKQPVIVWGTGQLTLKLLAETSLGRASIVAFTDGNPLNHGKILAGVEIIPPERLSGLPPHPIVLGTLLHQDAIRDRIRSELKLSNPIVMLSDVQNAHPKVRPHG